MPDDIRLIAATTHGRVILREPAAGRSRGLLVGFHGYFESAEIQLERLALTPWTEPWTLLSMQGLHRVYRGRSQDVVASWMTSQDRDLAIADNIEYVNRAVESVPAEARRRVVYAGFSQGVAMAFRAGTLGRIRADGIIAVGGDVPPELLADPGTSFPPLLLARGARDEWYTQSKFDADVAALAARAVAVRPLIFDGGHEWNAAVATAAGDLLGTIRGAVY